MESLSTMSEEEEKKGSPKRSPKKMIVQPSVTEMAELPSQNSKSALVETEPNGGLDNGIVEDVSIR